MPIPSSLADSQRFPLLFLLTAPVIAGILDYVLLTLITSIT